MLHIVSKELMHSTQFSSEFNSLEYLPFYRLYIYENWIACWNININKICPDTQFPFFHSMPKHCFPDSSFFSFFSLISYLSISSHSSFSLSFSHQKEKGKGDKLCILNSNEKENSNFKLYWPQKFYSYFVENFKKFA